MGSVVRWFAAAFGVAFGTAAGLAATAAVGDFVRVAKDPHVEITSPHPGAFADAAIAADCWSGSRSSMMAVRVYRGTKSITNAQGETEQVTAFFCQAKGLKTATPEDTCDALPDCVGVVD